MQRPLVQFPRGTKRNKRQRQGEEASVSAWKGGPRLQSQGAYVSRQLQWAAMGEIQLKMITFKPENEFMKVEEKEEYLIVAEKPWIERKTLHAEEFGRQLVY